MCVNMPVFSLEGRGDGFHRSSSYGDLTFLLTGFIANAEKGKSFAKEQLQNQANFMDSSLP